MARISYVEPANAPAEVKEIYEKTLKGQPENFQKAMAHRPKDLKNFTAFFASVGRGLERRLYSLVYMRVSVINHCNY